MDMFIMRKNLTFVIILTVLVWISSCDKKTEETAKEISREVSEEKYKNVIKKLKDNTVSKKTLIEQLSNLGYTIGVMDSSENVCNPESMEEFCKTFEKEEKKEAICYMVSGKILIQYEFLYENRKLKVIETAGELEDGTLSSDLYWNQYYPESFSYTEHGWFFWKDRRPEGFDGPSGTYGIRLRTRTEEEKIFSDYISYTGYWNNNLFTVDWGADDYSRIEFMDLFDLYYRKEEKQDPNFGDYKVPQELFERMICSHLEIRNEELQSLAHMKNGRYPWIERRIRQYPEGEMPVPEVRSWKKQRNGTIVLEIAAVWPEYQTDTAFTHKTTIRKTSDKFYYVANKVEHFDGERFPPYIPRKTGEEE